MLKPLRKLLAASLLAFVLVAAGLVAGGTHAWTPAALAQGTIPPTPGSNDGNSNGNSNQNDSQDSSQDNPQDNSGRSSDSGSGSAQDTMSAAQAPSPRASSPEQPLPYTEQWVTIQPGEWQWYAFKYSYDRNRNSDSDKSNDQVAANLRLDAEPENGVSLLLVNTDQVRAWQSGEKLQGFGAATPATDQVQNKADVDRFCHDYPDDPICTGRGNREQSACENLRDPASNQTQCKYRTSQSRGYSNWKGAIGATGTYYIVVRGDPRAAGPIRYKFTFGGEGLTMK